jgi:hypothetical protein
MTNIRPLATIVAVAGCVFPIAASAHHSYGMFDLQKDITFTGTVVEYNWENPHAHIVIKVPPTAQDKSLVGNWDIEGGPVNIMMRQGWTRATYKPGDPITLVARPMKDGSKGASLYYAIMPNGERLYMDIARPGEKNAAQK